MGGSVCPSVCELRYGEKLPNTAKKVSHPLCARDWGKRRKKSETDVGILEFLFAVVVV